MTLCQTTDTDTEKTYEPNVIGSWHLQNREQIKTIWLHIIVCPVIPGLQKIETEWKKGGKKKESKERMNEREKEEIKKGNLVLLAKKIIIK